MRQGKIYAGVDLSDNEYLVTLGSRSSESSLIDVKHGWAVENSEGRFLMRAKDRVSPGKMVDFHDDEGNEILKLLAANRSRIQSSKYVLVVPDQDRQIGTLEQQGRFSRTWRFSGAESGEICTVKKSWIPVGSTMEVKRDDGSTAATVEVSKSGTKRRLYFGSVELDVKLLILAASPVLAKNLMR
ncbi:MAG: hypothetical protein ABEK59_01605 [Halobacteria archaeon]